MNKFLNKNWLIIIFTLFISGIFFAHPANAGTLSCSVTTAAACTSPSVIILRMSAATNAHSELPSQSTPAYANNVICCTGVTDLGNSCSGVYAVVAKLSGTTNAHIQQSGSYPQNACISVPTGGTVSVVYQTNNCDGYDTTLGSMSAAGNAHVGNGTAYTTKICASAAVAVNTLTIGVTAGSKVTTVNSGDTNQYAHSTSCSAPSGCAAFTLNVSITSVTVTSIKITETGTAAANTDLSNLALFYDTNGNWADAETETQYGSTVASFAADQTATVSGSLALTAATTYYFYVRFDAKSGTPTYPKGGQTVNFQIAANGDVVFTGTATTTGAPQTLAGTTNILPNATTTTYGSGLSDGGRSTESIIISGYGFGVAPVGSRGNCSGAVDTGCVRLTVGGNATVATGDVSAWSNISISYTINASLASYGGASAVEVVAGSQADATKLTFYIYPRISSLTVPTAVADAAREYDAGDSDGLITLNGDHFGTAPSTGYVRILGCDATTCTSPTGSVEIQTGTTCDAGDPSPGDGWSGTCIRARVPTVIADNSYTGNVAMQQGTGGNSKTHTFGNTFRVLPRIISNTPTADIVGSRVKITGNHFCQGAGCPVSPNRSTASDNVKFGSTQALDSDFVNSGASPCSGNAQAWTDTEICVKVPAGTPTGSQPTKVTSNTYTSNTKDFTVQTSVPNNPTVTEPPNRQFKSDNSTTISLGGTTNETTVILKADISASIAINMRLQIEVQPTGTFTCTGSDPIGSGGCAAYSAGAGALEGTVGGGGGCDNCTSLSQAKITFTNLTDTTKHWQARVRNSSTNEYSSWVSYGGNPESGTDFKVDATPPTITFTPIDTCAGGQSNLGTNSVTISWNLDESADGQIEYSKNSDLSSSSNYPVPPESSAVSHSITLSNLDSDSTYYYKVKSRDAADNLAQRPSSAPYCSFTTGSVGPPAKTTSFHIAGATDVITGATNYYFSIVAPENGISVKNAFVEVTGLVSGGSNTITVKVNGVSSRVYNVSASNPTHYRFVYKIISPDNESNLNLNDASPCTNGATNPSPPPDTIPPCNKLTVTPGSGMSVSINSARIIINYAYTP